MLEKHRGDVWVHRGLTATCSLLLPAPGALQQQGQSLPPPEPPFQPAQPQTNAPPGKLLLNTLPDAGSGHKAPSRAHGTPHVGDAAVPGQGEGPTGSRVGAQLTLQGWGSCPLQIPPTGPRDSKTSRVMSTLSLLLSSPRRSPASIQLH